MHALHFVHTSSYATGTCQHCKCHSCHKNVSLSFPTYVTVIPNICYYFPTSVTVIPHTYHCHPHMYHCHFPHISLSSPHVTVILHTYHCHSPHVSLSFPVHITVISHTCHRHSHVLLSFPARVTVTPPPHTHTHTKKNVREPFNFNLPLTTCQPSRNVQKSDFLLGVLVGNCLKMDFLKRGVLCVAPLFSGFYCVKACGELSGLPGHSEFCEAVWGET